MMILTALLIFNLFIPLNTRYSLHYSDIRQGFYPTFDCLYTYLVDVGKEKGKDYLQNSYLTPYCRRPDVNEEQDETLYPVYENIIKTSSFKELKRQNVTSEQLLQWFSPIDIAEKYEMYRNDSDVFHNCSLPWFGSMCQYKFNFDFDSYLSFSDIVQATTDAKTKNASDISTRTYYGLLTSCNRGSWPLCLDWREICDGKFDCINGEDEYMCDQLEMTECNSNEYRCHYGTQCIPLVFLKDGKVSIDCLDGSDEAVERLFHTSQINWNCLPISTFRCEEQIGRYPESFQCGDGEYLLGVTLPITMVSCSNQRDKEVSRAMLTNMEHISSINCRETFYCALHSNRTFGSRGIDHNGMEMVPILEDIRNEECESLSQYCESEWLVIPAYPILFGFFQFIYFTNRSVDEFKTNIKPDLICFNAQACPALLTEIHPIKFLDGLTCCHSSDLIFGDEMKDFNYIDAMFSYRKHDCARKGIEKSCKNSSYFYCNESMKCISFNRVGDGNNDCYFGEDERFNACQLNDSNRFQCSSEENKCLSLVAVGNTFDECRLGEDELFAYTQNWAKLVQFPYLCNNEHHPGINFDGLNDTDETNCDYWPCDNPYTHCNQYWNCQHGTDELNCPNSKCSFNEHECYNQQSGLSYCLSLHNTYDKYVNCCNETYVEREIYFYNGTFDISENYFSWNDSEYITLDKVCRIDQHLQPSFITEDICFYPPENSFSPDGKTVKLIPNNEYLCHYINSEFPKYYDLFFKTLRLGYFPSVLMNNSIATISKTNQLKKTTFNISNEFISYCHRGILVLRGRNQIKTCFCPPNYYGSQCQWQNQRISLTIQLVWRSNRFTPVVFQVLIILIDEYGQIAPYYEQIIYIPNRDCNTKFNLYLLYPERPKSLSNNYSIRIDIYEKIKLEYWSSWHLSIPFQFLPVNRIATQLIIPEMKNEKSTCILSCGEHGKCMNYVNNKSLFFCLCDNGYSGINCNITNQCNCANDSLCLSSDICICSLYKFGPYCHLTHSICQLSNNSCQHNELCVPNDYRIDLNTFTCLCQDEYSDERCENKNNRIDIHLNKEILWEHSLLLIHVITSFDQKEHERRILLKKVPYNQNILTIHLTQPFHIILAEIVNESFYLLVVREVFQPSEYIQTKIESKQRCPSINNLLNDTVRQYSYLRRTKYYPSLCHTNLELMCFYDEVHMCICDRNRFSNCFLFNQTRNNDCQGYNYCENGGECFFNNQTCPTQFMCICDDCYYGAKCQLSTKGFGFSLDSILGYHIKPKISLNQQPVIIKITIFISTMLLVIGSINGFLSIETFRRIKSRQVGAGYYLLSSSIISIFIIILLTYKVWELILSQMSVITNRSFLYFNCVTIDVILKILLTFNEWCNACVAMERMMSVILATRFQKQKSIKMAKWVVLITFIFTILTHIHEPIRRELIEDFDIDDYRIWCFVRYSSSVRKYNSFITLFHFLAPFSINIISALCIIITLAYRRSAVEQSETLRGHLKNQIQQHAHVLYSPCILILLSLPRLIISFANKCMRSAHQPWLHLIGYFLSFIPSMLLFIVFVMPSKTYRREFKAWTKQISQKLCTTR
ncbi:unnamed protein product [Adineta steineri]|uniref:EGF-like domain-containing protein n=1 Tax=Adineta steineri TaxID=433720 RepID=A0A814UR32_9BILA|nr:unnamed protein product [Adineta steineri]CAF1387963.1 unnamed protein product [Adineta steineri]